MSDKANFKGKTILLTGGSGDLGTLLIPKLIEAGAEVRSIDVAPHTVEGVKEYSGSIIDRSLVLDAVDGADLIIHIAAWHGYHEFTGEKSDEEFFDVNMKGTFNLLDACKQTECRKFLFISSSSVDEWPGIYGMTKQLGEDMLRGYAERLEMQTLSLRPRAFIPWWNKKVYSSYLEWARWFSGGAVHIEDVNAATLLGVQYLLSQEGQCFEAVEIDGKHDFSESDLAQWKEQGSEAFLARRYGEVFAKAKAADFLPDGPPSYKDLSPAMNLIGYEPSFGYGEMLEGLPTK